jgi:sulfane dehydrogenase subunit SoxC
VVLQEAGLKPDAKWVVAEGADAAAMTRSIPIEKCLEDTMLAYSQNGERLRPQQGYPLRLVVPGYEGNMNVKWVRRLKVTAEPVYSREETSKYTDLLPDGTAREFSFFMEAKSIITRPSGGQRLNAPGFHEITGIAWSGHGKIARVEISVDNGKSWQDARLQEPVLTRALTRFRLPWRWDGKPAVIQSRAIDETGYVQPMLSELLAVRGENYFYHNNAIWPWRIAADGEVTNALTCDLQHRRCNRGLCLCKRSAGAKPVRHRAPGDGCGDRRLEYRYRARRQQSAEGKWLSQPRARGVRPAMCFMPWRPRRGRPG